MAEDQSNKQNIETNIITAKERLEICRECPWFRAVIQQCKKCSCIMPAKVLIKSAACPIRKW
jgi:glycerol-3-phosphate cytidylyltransferase-like family protein